MYKRHFPRVAGSAVLALLLASACGQRGERTGGDTRVAAADTRVASADSACTAPAAWFPTVQQPVNFQVNDNCSFHRWAWQEFLYMMQPGGGSEANFLTLAYPQDLFVDNPGPFPGRTTGTRLKFMPRDLKDEELQDSESIHQAGDHGVLIDQRGQPLFYTILLDSTWYNFARTNGLNTAAGFKAAAATLNFPTTGTGAIELKTAWRVAAVGDSTYIPNASSRFFTTQGLIPTVTIANGRFVTDTTRMRSATLALAGMHVVGTVPGHAEFIWATFEQVDNAPLCSRTPVGGTNDSTGNPWSLYPANLSCANGNCNVKPDTLQASFKPTPICRAAAFGDTSAASANAQNIQNLNASVQGQLASNSILRFYRLVGGQWTNAPGGLPAIFGDTTNIRGSPLLANVTMESFLQPSAPDSGKTCFGCHNGGTTQDPRNVEVSHVWPRRFTRP